MEDGGVATDGRGDERGALSNQYSVFCRGPPASPFGQPLAGCLAPLGCIQIGEGRGGWQEDGGQKEGLGTTNFTEGTNGRERAA